MGVISLQVCELVARTVVANGAVDEIKPFIFALCQQFVKDFGLAIVERAVGHAENHLS